MNSKLGYWITRIIERLQTRPKGLYISISGSTDALFNFLKRIIKR